MPDQLRLTVPSVVDLACPKCGHSDVRIAYCDSSPTLRPWSSVVKSHEDDYCGMHDPEHFHRSCRRCSYRWRTDDTLGRRADA